MFVPGQPVFPMLGSGVQLSTNGTSQTFLPPPTSRVHDASVQSVSARQNWKQRQVQPSLMHVNPGAQLSVCIGDPSKSMSHGCSSVLGNPVIRGGRQVKAPAWSAEHFWRHPQPVWQTGSHSPGAGSGGQLAFGSKQIGTSVPSVASIASTASTASIASTIVPPSRFFQQVCDTGSHLNPSGHAFAPPSGLHFKPPSRIFGL
jgi:hypothetical protein